LLTRQSSTSLALNFAGLLPLKELVARQRGGPHPHVPEEPPSLPELRQGIPKVRDPQGGLQGMPLGDLELAHDPGCRSLRKMNNALKDLTFPKC
jgi:hypothetical protein